MLIFATTSLVLTFLVSLGIFAPSIISTKLSPNWNKQQWTTKSAAILALVGLLTTAACGGKSVEETAVAEAEVVVPLPLDSLFLDLTKKDTFEYNQDPMMDGFISSSNGASQGYVKEFIRNYGSNQLLEAGLTLYEFADSTSARQSYDQQQKDHFSKTIVDEDTGKEKKNPFLSKKIEIESIGDDSFCYKFVSPTVVVLYGKYIIESDVSITIEDGVRVVGPFTMMNSFLDNDFTLGKSVEIAKKQVEKLKSLNHR
jgi:hypothetical protein